MRIKTNARIQRAVDLVKGSDISRLAACHIVASSLADDNSMVGCFQLGIYHALRMVEKYNRAVAKIEAGPKVSGAVGGPITASPPKNFGIYVATQETSDGDDLLYFIGTPDDIVAKIQKFQ